MFRRSRALAATATVATLFAASLVLSSCTNPIEQFIEDQTGVSIDSDGDGSVTVESEDGEMTITAGTEVPDDFPGEVPLPSTGTLESSVAKSAARYPMRHSCPAASRSRPRLPARAPVRGDSRI